MKIKHINCNSKVAKFETISGCEGLCLGVNDYRVSGPKPWGGGTVMSKCFPNKERVLKLIDGKEYVDIYVIDCGNKGFWIDGINLSRKGTKDDYNNHLKKIFRQVKTEDIKKAMNSPYYVEC